MSEEMRGRVMRLFPLAMGLPTLNGAPVSAAGQWLGLEVVFPIIAWATPLLSGAIIFGRPALRRVDPGTRVSAESRVPSIELWLLGLGRLLRTRRHKSAKRHEIESG